MHSRTFIVSITCIFFAGCSDPRDQKCQEASQQYIQRAKAEWKRDYTLLKTRGFYSKKFDACIHVEEKEVGLEVEVRDLTQSILKDGGNHNLLLHCDENDADSIRIDKVTEHKGRTLEVPYADWLDDGNGGPPRALKTPALPYTKAQCKVILEKWETELKK